MRAPFAGVVAAKPVSAGDVVSPGGELFTIVDPKSMKLTAAMPAAQVSAVRVGAPVQFVIQGYPGRVFTGRVQRINPSADPATRQVGVYITIPNTGGSLVSGLYAEGRVGTERRGALVVPAVAVDLASAIPSVVRVKNGKVEKVNVTVGIRDEQNERVEILTGVAAGDTLLIGAAQGISPGTPVRVQRIDAPSAPAKEATMFISDFAIKRPIVTVVSMMALVAFGLYALMQLETDEFPDIAAPIVTVSVPYPGASPDVVEREVIDRVEEAISGINGVDRMQSVSTDGFGSVMIVVRLRERRRAGLAGRARRDLARSAVICRRRSRSRSSAGSISRMTDRLAHALIALA